MATYEKLVIEAVFKLPKSKLEGLKSTGTKRALKSWMSALSKGFLYEPLGFIDDEYPTGSENTDENFVYPQSPGTFMLWLMSQKDKEILIFIDEKTGLKNQTVKVALSLPKERVDDFIVLNKHFPFESETATFKIDIKATRITEEDR